MLSTPVRFLILTVLATACEEGLAPSPTGTIEITSVTEGEPADPDGYTVAIDERQEPLAANATTTVAGVALGEHRLELLGVAPNCRVAGANPRTIALSGDGMLRLTLEVSCGPGRGSITVRSQSMGPNPDPDGYTVSLDHGAGQRINLNGFATFPAIAAGDHALVLSEVAANCAIGGSNPRAVTVAAGRDTMVTFDITCRSTATGTLLITSDRSGQQQVYGLAPDGTGLQDLTPDAQGALPDWSPDRTRIAFGSTRDGNEGVYVMNADGSSPVRLATGRAPVWSPDGSRIAYSGPDGITVMQADGSNPVVLASGHDPAWSPDGAHIAFNRGGPCAGEICGVDLYVMNADGSAVHRLTSGDFWGFLQSPSWSPDGTLIAFIYVECGFFFECGSGIGTIEPSGGTPSRVYAGDAVGRPVWSPDGMTLGFAVQQENGTTELMLMPSRGGRPAAVGSSPGSEYPGSWR